MPGNSITMKKLTPLLLALFHPANALPVHRRIPDILKSIKEQKLQEELTPFAQFAQEDTSIDEFNTDIETLYFDQRLDHFSDEEENSDTFQQRYFYTSRYVHDNDGNGNNNNNADATDDATTPTTLAFICLGGEGPSLTTSVLLDSPHCTGDMIALAERLFHRGVNVHLFAIEHRFYGESFPQNNNNGYHLRGSENEDGSDFHDVDFSHLSSRQAVKDVINFVQSSDAAQKTSSSSNASSSEVRWITFGGSYPGMLSAWCHLLHPDVIFAAVSSSSPIQAQLDNYGYNDIVNSDLGDESVGGSEECQRIFREGHQAVVATMEGENDDEAEDDGEGGLDRVAELFNVCDGGDALRASRRNQEAFVGDGLFYVPAQSNDPACEGGLCNIEKICKAMIDEKESNQGISSMEILATIKNLKNHGDEDCTNVNWGAYLLYLKTPTNLNANDRSWMYQTCSEFGFYLTCNQDSECPYGRGYHDVDQDLEMCQEVFGIDPSDVENNVDSTLSYYGGWSLTPNTTGEDKVRPKNAPLGLSEGSLEYDGQKRLIFAYGSVDPWTALAVTSGNEDHPSVGVAGASHHFWTHQVKDSDAEEVRAARQTIYETVEGWLGLSTEGLPSIGGETVVFEKE